MQFQEPKLWAPVFGSLHLRETLLNQNEPSGYYNRFSGFIISQNHAEAQPGWVSEAPRFQPLSLAHTPFGEKLPTGAIIIIIKKGL